MSRISGWLYSLRALLRRDAADRDMADEIAFHVDRQARKHEAGGMAPADARRLALREFGGTTQWREEARNARGSILLDVAGQDLRQTIRGLRRDPVFASMAVVTLALAIGANATMFGVIDRLMLRGPEYATKPDQLVRLFVTRRAPGAGPVTLGWQPYAFYEALRGKASTVSSVAIYAPNRLRVGIGTEARFIPVTYATPDLFALVGVHPLMGRFFSVAEDRLPTGQPVVVLGYQFWQRSFAGDSAVIGKLVTLGDRQLQVIGIAPKGFTGVDRAPVDAWLPFSAVGLNPGFSADWATDWRSGLATIVARLTAPKGAAEAQLTTRWQEAFTGSGAAMRKATVSLRPISYGTEGAEPPELGVARLLAGVALVMLIVATANASNLSLARAMRRRRELGVRSALGADRWRIARLMIAESLTIALMGGVLGVGLSQWGGELICRALLPNVAWSELPVDGRVLLWTAVATCLAGMLIGLIPALRVTGGDVVAALRGGRTDGSGAGETNGRSRAALQIVQLALSLVLLFTAGLFVKSLWDIRRLDLGYDRERVLAVDIAFPRSDTGSQDAAVRDRAAARVRYEDLRARFARLPGVAAASIAFSSPLSAIEILRVHVPGLDSLPPSKGGRAIASNVAPGYFETVGTRLVEGRTFTQRDVEGAESVIIISKTMATTIWPGAGAIGHCAVIGGKNGGCARIVGVVQDVHHMALKEPALSQVYIPWGPDQGSIEGSVLLVRVRDDPSRVSREVTDVLRNAAPGMQSVEIKTFDELLDPQVRPWRVGALLFGAFGAIVVLVSAIGLFSVVSYLVTQRTHEFGVRIALGARNAQVLRLVIVRGLRTAITGALVGAVVSVAIAPIIQPLLFDNGARDPTLLVGVTVGLLVVAAMASAWPAWRATRVDPLLALRSD